MSKPKPKPKTASLSWQAKVLRVVCRLGVKTPLRLFGAPYFAIRIVRVVNRFLAHSTFRGGSQVVTQTQTSPVAGLWVTPSNALDDRIIYFVHGGAFVIGSNAMYLRFASALGKAAQAKVFMIDYRLAPEHPFPQGLKDVEQGWRWLNEHYAGRAQLAIAADSAGANLALGALLGLQSNQGEQAQDKRPKVAMAQAAVFCSPWTDLSLSGDSIAQNQTKDPYVPISVMPQILDHYLNGHGAEDQRASPLFSDFTGFAPMLVQVTRDEVLFDDSRRLVEKAKAADVEAELLVWQGMVHVFQLFPTMVPEARQSIAQMGAFIDRQFLRNKTASTRQD